MPNTIYTEVKDYKISESYAFHTSRTKSLTLIKTHESLLIKADLVQISNYKILPSIAYSLVLTYFLEIYYKLLIESVRIS